MSWQSELKKEARELESYTDEIESKLRFAEKRLADISSGVYYADEAEDSWELNTKARVTAAKGLAKLSAMPCRKRPSAWRF